MNGISRFEDGDFIVSGYKNPNGSCEWVAKLAGEFEEGYYDTYFGAYLNVSGNQEEYKNKVWLTGECTSQSYNREATEEEINFLMKNIKELAAYKLDK